ncbi:MAG: 50S ribosomal protein L23 [Leptolyngbya sp.]|nr:50S ribosomal protein L23 [Candidatus Melainabacteria bacterium]
MNTRQSQIILRPIITEKSAQMTQLGQYTFEVLRDANKIEIAQAVEQLIKELYPKCKTSVVAVNTSAIRGRFRSKKRHGAHPKDSKKAIVTVEGDPLDLFNG